MQHRPGIKYLTAVQTNLTPLTTILINALNPVSFKVNTSTRQEAGGTEPKATGNQRAHKSA
jgi:hypothetical protein